MKFLHRPRSIEAIEVFNASNVARDAAEQRVELAKAALLFLLGRYGSEHPHARLAAQQELDAAIADLARIS